MPLLIWSGQGGPPRISIKVNMFRLDHTQGAAAEHTITSVITRGQICTFDTARRRWWWVEIVEYVRQLLLREL